MVQSYGIANLSEGAGAPFAALVVGDQAAALSGVPGLNGSTVQAILDEWDANLPLIESAAANLRAARPLSDFRAHAPYIPRQVFCTGANYRQHVIGLIMGDPSQRGGADSEITDPVELRRRAEAIMDERAKSALPYIWVKLPSSVVGPQDNVILPRNVQKPDWELELGVVIGKRARHTKASEAMNYVAGFAVTNDVTAREHIFRRDAGAIGTDWLASKCFPTFLPFGPMIVPRRCVPDPYNLNIKLSVNGKVYQDETTADMLINIERQVEYLSERVELTPGDLICTGSPAGNGSAHGVFLKDGDVMEGAITGLGVQRNRCVAEH